MDLKERAFKIVAGSTLTVVGYLAYLKGIEWLTKGTFNITD